MISIQTIFSSLPLAAAESGKAPFGLDSQILMPVILIVMFYFLLIRPQQRQRKEQAARIAALANGDKVTTTAGIHGIVHNIKESTVVVKVGEGTFIEFDKPAISAVRKKDSEA